MALRPPHRTDLLPVKPAFSGFHSLGSDARQFPALARHRLVDQPASSRVTLLYWCIHQPRRLGFAAAWVLGLATDIGDASLFGQHALAYTLLAYAGITLHRRVLSSA